MPRLFLMFEGIEYDFWLLRVWIPGAVSGNCLVTNGLREVWLLCCFDVRWTCLPVLASGGDSGISKGTFALAGVYAAFFCSVMHHCVVRRSGSVPTEITEPTLEAWSSRHVIIETLQSKDFSEILLICVNFGVTASRFCRISWGKNLYESSMDNFMDASIEIRNIMGAVW